MKKLSDHVFTGDILQPETLTEVLTIHAVLNMDNPGSDAQLKALRAEATNNLSGYKVDRVPNRFYLGNTCLTNVHIVGVYATDPVYQVFDGRLPPNLRPQSGMRVTVDYIQYQLDKVTIARPPLAADDVEWVVNSHAELGVKIGDQFFWLYKGGSLVYENEPGMKWRPVGKREFGECAHPIRFYAPGTVIPEPFTTELAYLPGLSDGKPEDYAWRDLPPAIKG